MLNLISSYATISYFLLVLAFAMTSFFWLRVISILSCVFAILYYFSYQTESNLIIITSEVIFIIINAYKLMILYLEKRIPFTKDEKDIYAKFFNSFTPRQMRKIFNTGEFSHFLKGEHLYRQGDPVKHLHLITDGIAEVKINDQVMAYIKKGNLVGEIAFVTEKPASATVKTTHTITSYCFNGEKLRNLFRKEPEIAKKMGTFFIKESINKIVILSKNKT